MAGQICAKLTSLGTASVGSSTANEQNFAVEENGEIGTSDETSPVAGELKIWVANQSRNEPAVDITVAIDSVLVLDIADEPFYFD